MITHQLIPLCCYCAALLVLVLVGSWAIAQVRQQISPAPMVEVQL